jgi:hypothetical protein
VREIPDRKCVRYVQSKLADTVYAAELVRRYPGLTCSYPRLAEKEFVEELNFDIPFLFLSNCKPEVFMTWFNALSPALCC